MEGWGYCAARNEQDTEFICYRSFGLGRNRFNGLLFGNLNALAMEPIGHIAGVGAGVVATLSTFISVPFGAIVGHSFDGTMYALIAAFGVFGAGTYAAMRWAEGGRGRSRDADARS